jgi:oxalate decarboxylase
MADMTRRGALGAAVAAAGGLLASSAGGADHDPDKGKSDYGLPNFRFAIEAQKGKVDEGGSAKEATIVEFPISKGIAGVSMRLDPGGLRELHWHAIAAEWAFVLKGRVRATVIDPAGNFEQDDFGPGDVWYFPRGHGHAVQGLGPGEAHFILVFDDGAFSEFGTFGVTDWVAHTPPDVLARNLGLPAATFADFPKRELYITKGPVPPAMPTEAHSGLAKAPPLTHKFRLMAQAPRVFPGGTLRVVSAKEFPISTTMTGALMTLEPGALRELHWHPNADEWQYFIQGQARMGVFGSSGRARALDFAPGEVGYVPRGYGHYIENTGAEELRVLVLFNSGTYEEIALATWLASNPRQLLAANFHISEELVAKFPKATATITSKESPRP